MPRQISLDLDSDKRRADALWNRLSEHCRRDTVAIWLQLIARAVRGPTTTQRDREEQP